MASMLQNVKATIGWQRRLLLADLDENESPVPDKFKRKASFSSLHTICMSLRKRIPLKQVELNFHETPLWENMEARNKSQVFQSITKTARNAFGTVSQVVSIFCFNFSTKIVGLSCTPESLSSVLHNVVVGSQNIKTIGGCPKEGYKDGEGSRKEDMRSG